MVQSDLVTKKRGRPPINPKSEVLELGEVSEPTNITKSNPLPVAVESELPIAGVAVSKSPTDEVVGTTAEAATTAETSVAESKLQITVPRKRGRPPIHPKPGPEPRPRDLVGTAPEPESKSKGDAVENTVGSNKAGPKSVLVESTKPETTEKTSKNEKKKETSKKPAVEEKLENVRKFPKTTVQSCCIKRPLERPTEESPFKWRRVGEPCYAPGWPARSFPVVPVRTHTILLMTLCGQCVHETNQRIRVFQPGGKEFIGVVMCQQCIKKNAALFEAFK